MTTIMLQRRFLHTTSSRLNITTALFPGQGNVTPEIFSLTHHQVDDVRNRHYTDLINHAQHIVPNVPIAKYFSRSSFPSKEIQSQELSNTSFVQPLVLLATYLNYTIYKNTTGWDIRNANYLLGHSLGELSALVVQDVISLEDGLNIAYNRGLLMEKVLQSPKNRDKKWGMVALMFRERDFLSILKVCKEDCKLNIANINGYEQIVVSGEKGELMEKLNKLDIIQKRLTNAKVWRSKIRKKWLQTEIPAHNPIFNDIKDELRGYFKLKSDTLSVPIICNYNGLIVAKNAQRVVDNFINGTSSPVEFTKCLESIITTNENTIKETERFKFINVSDVTYGLTKRFFKDNDKCQIFDLIEEINSKE